MIRQTLMHRTTTGHSEARPSNGRKPSASFVFVTLTIASVTIAVAQRRDGDRERVYAELAKAPPTAAARHNPLETDPNAVAAGAKLFELHCAKCHGETAAGAEKGPSLRGDEVQQATSGTLFWILTNGVVRRGMPVWSKLPEPQRWQIVAYLKSLGPQTKPPVN